VLGGRDVVDKETLLRPIAMRHKFGWMRIGQENYYVLPD
jgi:hypothetical protein